MALGTAILLMTLQDPGIAEVTNLLRRDGQTALQVLDASWLQTLCCARCSQVLNVQGAHLCLVDVGVCKLEQPPQVEQDILKQSDTR